MLATTPQVNPSPIVDPLEINILEIICYLPLKPPPLSSKSKSKKGISPFVAPPNPSSIFLVDAKTLKKGIPLSLSVMLKRNEGALWLYDHINW